MKSQYKKHDIVWTAYRPRRSAWDVPEIEVIEEYASFWQNLLR